MFEALWCETGASLQVEVAKQGTVLVEQSHHNTITNTREMRKHTSTFQNDQVNETYKLL